MIERKTLSWEEEEMLKDNWLLALGVTMVAVSASYFGYVGHKRSKTWDCSDCGKEFKSKDGYIKHKKKVHKEKIDKAYNLGFFKIVIMEKKERTQRRRTTSKKKAS